MYAPAPGETSRLLGHPVGSHVPVDSGDLVKGHIGVPQPREDDVHYGPPRASCQALQG
jgi:hypothetical protein